MARPLCAISDPKFSSLVASMAAFSILSLAILLCAKARRPRRMQGSLVSKINSNISSRAVSMAKMISWRKVEAADEDENCDCEEEEVWRKTIIRGERCRPLQFSGKIDYDSEGNLLTDSKRDDNCVA